MRGILTDDVHGDLLIKNGSLVVGNCEQQVIQTVLLTNRGEFKEYPLIGAELAKLTNGVQDPFWANDTKKMLQACGIQINRLHINDNEITIE